MRRLACWLGLHNYYRVAPFIYGCDACGKTWWADYFEWRRSGYPVWRRCEWKEEAWHAR